MKILGNNLKVFFNNAVIIFDLAETWVKHTAGNHVIRYIDIKVPGNGVR